MDFNLLKTNKGKIIEGVKLIKPKIFSDERGYFYESWNSVSFRQTIGNIEFCQDNHSQSSNSVLRGIHYQSPPYAQGKLIRCTRGTIFDVVVDLRKKSSTYKQWASVELDEINKSLLWIPEGFGHGFLTLSDSAEIQYKVNKPWNRDSEISILWNDPNLLINWPLNKIDHDKPILSKKDSNGMSIKIVEKLGLSF